MMGLMTMIRITMTMVKMMRLYLQRLGSCEECAGGNKSGKVTLKSKNGNTHNTLEKEVTDIYVNSSSSFSVEAQ